MWAAYRPDSTMPEKDNFAPGVVEQFNAMAEEAIEYFKNGEEGDLMQRLWDEAMRATKHDDKLEECDAGVKRGMQRIASAAMEYLLLVPRSRLDK